MKSIYYHQVKTLKQAIYDTIHHHETLSVAAIAEQIDMAPSYLYRAATLDPDTEGPEVSGVRFPLKYLMPLVRVTGDFQILDLIEFSLGRVAIPIPKPEKTNTSDLQTKALNAVIEFGDFIKAVTLSIQDGTITCDEQQKLEREGNEAIQAIMILLSQKSK